AVAGRDGQGALLDIDFLHLAFDAAFDGRRLLFFVLAVHRQGNGPRECGTEEKDEDALRHDARSPEGEWCRRSQSRPEADWPPASVPCVIEPHRPASLSGLSTRLAILRRVARQPSRTCPSTGANSSRHTPCAETTAHVRCRLQGAQTLRSQR